MMGISLEYPLRRKSRKVGALFGGMGSKIAIGVTRGGGGAR